MFGNTVRTVAIEIVFETHATTEDNERGIATGWLPGRLSPRGRAQAEQLRRPAPPRRHPHRLHLGPRAGGRDRRNRLRLDRDPDPRRLAAPGVRLRGAQRDSRGLVRGRRAEHVDVAYPGGESWRAAADRVRRFLDDLPTAMGRRTCARDRAQRDSLGARPSSRAKLLEEIVDADFAWQEGWEYVVP